MPTDFDRITSDPHILGGRASIRGMRIPVSLVLEYLADGATIDDLLRDYPALELEDVRQALAYAAALVREPVHLPDPRAREAEQAKARARILEHLGASARLEPGEEEAILRDLDDPS